MSFGIRGSLRGRLFLPRRPDLSPKRYRTLTRVDHPIARAGLKSRISRGKRARQEWPDATFPVTSIPRWIQTIGVVLSVGAILWGRTLPFGELHIFRVLFCGLPFFSLAFLSGFAERWWLRMVASILLLISFALAILAGAWLAPGCIGIILTVTLLAGVGQRKRRPAWERSDPPSDADATIDAEGGAGMFTGKSDVMLYVRDVVRSIRFYRDRLGFTVDRYWSDAAASFVPEWTEEAPPDYAEILAGGNRFALHAAKEEPGNAGAIFHFEVEDADAARAELEEAGADPGEARDFPWGTRMFFVKDPDGHTLGFYS